MRPLVLFIVAAAAFASEGRRIVEYDISATLLPKDRAVSATETLTWHNQSPDTVGELQFHLYLNAFRNKKSTFLREHEDGIDRLERGGWGWIDVKRMQVLGGPDLTKQIRFIQPDDWNTDDRTVITVPLPQPVKPGGSITLSIDFYSKLPHVFARTGYHGDFYMVAQWFPKIGVWEAAGERYSTSGHWNCHQFHAWTEFYADYGRYAVDLTVPANYVIGATGVNISRRDDAKANTSTYRFAQDDIHDFAWTASPRYIRVLRRFDPGREVTPRELSESAKRVGLTPDEVRLRPVNMILLVQPEHAAQIDRYFKALRTGIKYFGLWYGAYPYRTITVVDPPYGGIEAGGMEYPTLITGGTEWLVSPHQQTPEGVTVHEFGHQYWYGMVGNNEFEEAWLDEGFNTYSTDKILDLAYGPEPVAFRFLGIPFGEALGLPVATHDSMNRAVYLLEPKADALARNAWQYYDGLSYGINSYMRPGITLRTLENYVGAETMARIMRTYFQRWQYRHPTTRDFVAVVNEVSGRNMQWFFDQFFYGSNVLDYGVGEISSKKEGKNYESVVRIRRNGDNVFPVQVRIRFKDGLTLNRTWDGSYRWTEFRITRPAEIDSVEIDPDHKILLDASYSDNSHTDAFETTPLLKWSQNVLFWAENVFLGAWL